MYSLLAALCRRSASYDGIFTVTEGNTLSELFEISFDFFAPEAALAAIIEALPFVKAAEDSDVLTRVLEVPTARFLDVSRFFGVEPLTLRFAEVSRAFEV